MNRPLSRLIAWALVLTVALVCGTLCERAFGQSTRQTTTPGGKARPLSEALADLARQANIDLIFDPPLVAGLFTSIQIQSDVPAAQMLDDLLEGTGLEYRRNRSGTYTLGKSEVPSFVKTGILEGVVIDEETGEPLPNAHVLLAAFTPGDPIASPDGTRTVEIRNTISGKATDNSGKFTFANIGPGSYRLMAAFIGFETQIDTVQISSDRKTNVHFELEPQIIPLTPLIVDGSRKFGGGNILDLPPDFQDSNLSRLMGTPDIMRGLNQLIGVRVSDALADIHVQAGESGEHQFKLDGVPIFEPVHLRGLLGAFCPFAIQRITVHRAGFGAPYGSHLSGVLLAEHALSGPESRHFDFQIDPLSINSRFSGQVGRTGGVNGHFMIAGRVSVWNLYETGLYSPLKSLLREWNTPDTFLPFYLGHALQTIDPELSEIHGLDTLQVSPLSEPKLSYTDLHSAARIQFSPGNRLYASFYRGSNELNGNLVSITLGEENPGQSKKGAQNSSISTNRDQYQWVNTNGQVQYTSLIGNKFSASTRLRASRYSLTHSYNTLQASNVLIIPLENGSIFPLRLINNVKPADNGNSIDEVAIETQVGYAASRNHFLQTGAEIVNTESKFTIEDVFYLYRPIVQKTNNWRVGLFLQDEFSFGKGFSITAGTRGTLLSQHKQIFLEPRLAISRTLPVGNTGRWSWRVSSGIYRQFLNQFNVSSVSPSALLSSIRFWLPVDSTVSPQEAYHIAGGVEYSPSATWSLRTDVYYKNQPHILTIDYPGLLEHLSGLGERPWIEDPAINDSTNTPQNTFLKNGHGHAYGGTASIEYLTRKLRFLLRYEFNMAKRTRTLLSEDSGELGNRSANLVQTPVFETVPWNEPHRVDVSVDWRPLSNFTATVRWAGSWRRTWGFRQAYYDFLANFPIPYHQIGDISFRTPDRHDLGPIYQLDLGLAYTHDFKLAAVQLRGDVLNALNRKNIADWSARLVEDETGQSQIVQVPRRLLPRMPSVALRVIW